ncbi:DUF4123 domain-containing protein [Pseudomonas agarici]|uniref:DUF4123 domain-containing protein n=2 Tax=Pseudomonas agarici TaxID=46677 RepID=UPI0003829D7A|nr:DUF4123 domain-containing protein [Pseudomonas agarici]
MHLNPKETLIRTLSHHLHGDGQLTAYLLIDPLRREPFQKEQLVEWVCDVFAVPVKSPSLKEGQQPRLIKLTPKAIELLDQSVSLMLEEQADPLSESAQGFAIGGWLLTQATGESLARHLAACVQRTLYVTDQWKYFRWQDRRVMEWMWPSLTVFQQNALLGPIAQWWTLDRRDQLRMYQPDPATEVPLASKFGLFLDKQQRLHAHRCALIQTIIRGWLKCSPELPADYLRRVDRIVGRAIELGIEDPRDTALLAVHALQIHPNLLTHSKISALVDQANTQPDALAHLIGSVSDSEWCAIQQALGSDYLNPEHTRLGAKINE